jgi:hypothetical protein
LCDISVRRNDFLLMGARAGQHLCNDTDGSWATCQALRDWAYDITLASAGLDWIALQHSASLYMYSYLDANSPFTQSGRVRVRDVYGSSAITRGMTGGWSRRTMRTSVLLVTTQAFGSPSLNSPHRVLHQPTNRTSVAPVHRRVHNGTRQLPVQSLRTC